MAELFLSKSLTPILKVGADGTVLYANKAANVFLDYWCIKEGEKVPQSLRHNIKRALSQEKPESLEIRAGKKTYAVLLHPFPKEDCINFQGFDIKLGTTFKVAKRIIYFLSINRIRVCMNYL